MQVKLKATTDKTKSGKASVSSEIYQDDAFKTGFVSIQADGCSVSLEVEERFGAKGNQVWITPKTLGLVENKLKDAEIGSTTELKFRTSRILKTKAGLFALGAFLAAIIGAVIKLSFAIGDTGSVFWTVTPTTKSILIWISSCLELVGLIVLFVRGVWFGIK